MASGGAFGSVSQPLLDGASPEDVGATWNQHDDHPDPRTWTNAEVLRWLIKTDQKVFIPGAIAQHILGSTLLQLTQEEVRQLWSKTKVDFSVGDIALRSLFNSVESLRDEGRVCRELYGTEKAQDAFGRLIQSRAVGPMTGSGPTTFSCFSTKHSRQWSSLTSNANNGRCRLWSSCFRPSPQR